MRKDALVGWTCSPEFADRRRAARVRLLDSTPSLLNAVLAGGVYPGRSSDPSARPSCR